MFRCLVLLCLISRLVAGSSPSPESSAPVRVIRLSCEFLEHPLNLHTQQPRLSWQLISERRNVRQTAYRILVASSPAVLAENTGNLWDSGRVPSSQSVLVPYNGLPLVTGQHCYWKVQVWDEAGVVTDWSEPAVWEMGLLNPDNWAAQWIRAPRFDPVTSEPINRWIQRTASLPLQEQRLQQLTPAPLFRKQFTVPDSIRFARLHICAPGYYETYLNGVKVGKHVLDPAQTDYGQRALYVTYDVTGLLQTGANAWGIMSGDGWYHQAVAFQPDFSYGEPAVMARLEIELATDSTLTIVTDRSWRAAPGPIVKNNIYAGEVYDARREWSGWTTPAFDDNGWRHAMEVPALSPVSEPQLLPPIRVIRRIKPLHLYQRRPGVWVFDMGQNFAGWVRLKVKAPSGTAIALRYAEWADKYGTVDFSSTGNRETGVIQSDMYICNGDSLEIWEPRFTYHGFRYVEMTGFPGEPTLNTIEGVQVRTDVDSIGHFICADSLLNRIHEIALWTIESNLHGFPENCPHRERCGWLGDAHVYQQTVLYNYGAQQFYAKFVKDMETSAEFDGSLRNIAPGRRKAGKAVDGGVATILIPYYHYLFTGDQRLLRNHYAYMRRFMDFFYRQADHWIVNQGLGDRCDPAAFPGAERETPQHTPPRITATAYFYQSSIIMQQVATLLGDSSAALHYREWAVSIRDAFIRTFYDSTRHTYGSQTADAFAIDLGLFPPGDSTLLAASLAADVMEVHHGHFTTGSHGIGRLLPVLSGTGYDSVAYAVLSADGFPGFRYLFDIGATTLWEQVGSYDPLGRIPPTRSLNHPFHSGYDKWFTAMWPAFDRMRPGRGFDNSGWNHT